jgi:hypothetical protein
MNPQVPQHASHRLREIKHLRAKLHSVATKGIEPAVLKTIALGLRQMKENDGRRY